MCSSRLMLAAAAPQAVQQAGSALQQLEEDGSEAHAASPEAKAQLQSLLLQGLQVGGRHWLGLSGGGGCPGPPTTAPGRAQHSQRHLITLSSMWSLQSHEMPLALLRTALATVT